MNTRDLEYIKAVATHRHFGRAANACNVSQPTLSMQVKKLEERLGGALFERDTKHVMLTALGRATLVHADLILQHVRALHETAREMKEPLSGIFTLGAFPTLAPYFLPQVLPDIKRALPKLQLRLVEEKTEPLIQMLVEGELDAALLALPVEHPSLHVQPLFEDEFLAALPRGHRLSKRSKIDVQDLSTERLLLLEDGHCLRMQALELCQMSGAKEESFRASSLETLRAMVASGTGMTLIPAMAARSGDGLVYKRFHPPAPKRSIGLVFRNTSARKDVMRALGRLLCQPNRP